LSAKLISIIGPPAVGKTTLAETLAAELPAEVIYEDFSGNPFLADSYLGKEEARLPAQLYYLMSRAGQLSLLSWPAGGIRVSDYGFCQDRIYASLRLTDVEMKLYDRIAQRLERLVKQPDLVIQLDASDHTLLRRIADRGRQFEKAITADFIASIRKAYETARRNFRCEVINADCDRIDLRNSAACAELLGEIRKKL